MTAPCWLMDATFWTNTNKVIGLVVALVGCVVTAPEGFSQLKSWSGETVRQAVRRLPFMGRRQTARRSVAGTAEIAMKLTATARGYKWVPNAPVDERFDLVLAYINSVERRLNEAITKAAGDAQEHRDALAALEGRLNSKISDLSQAMDARDVQEAQIDARGLPVIFIGIFLSGIPDWLANWFAGWFVWFPSALGIAIAAAVSVSHWRASRP